MKIKVLTPGRAIIACGVCLIAAGVAAAQTTAPAAKPAAAATSPAATPAKAKPHHDAPAAGHFGPPHPPSFEELDTNHDGVVSKAEFDAWRAAHPMPGRPGGPGPDGDGPDGGHGDWHGGGHGGWGGGFEMRHEMMWMHMHEMERHHEHGRFGPRLDLDAADTDHDGKISWAEFQAAATAHLKEHFDHLDANHDGFIEKDELPGHGDHEGDHGHDWHHGDKKDKATDPAPTPAPAK